MAFKGNFSQANMSMDIQLFSAPVFNKAFTSLSCMLIGNVVPVSLPNIILKMCSISLETHSTKYPLGLLSWPENQGILFFYISQTLQMNRISFMAFLLNAVL